MAGTKRVDASEVLAGGATSAGGGAVATLITSIPTVGASPPGGTPGIGGGGFALETLLNLRQVEHGSRFVFIAVVRRGCGR